MKFAMRRVFPLSIRLQLTCWYVAVFALLLFLAGTLLYKHLETSLATSLDTALQLRAQQLAGGVIMQNGTIKLGDVLNELPGFDTDSPTPQVPASDVNWSSLVRLFDGQGHLLHETPAFTSLQVPQVSITQPLHEVPWQGTVTTQDGQQVRLYSRSVDQDGQLVAVVQVGQSLTELQETLHRVAIELLAMGIGVLLVSAIVSYWLATRALIPIHRLTQTARTIKGGDLHQRVPVPAAFDEVHFLAVTLNEMLASLEELFARQRRFVADASHELRTPVSVIRSKTDIALLEEMGPQEYINVLREINLETERLGHLINDLLALARGDEDQMRFEREPVRLDLLAEMVAVSSESLARARAITLQVHLSEPITVFGDEARLIQVMMNLVDNAICYTNAGGCVTLQVEARGQQACLSVRDTGIGIAPEHLPHIFERFYRADPARRRTEGSSSGLGLAIVEWVVRVHGGTVSVESQIDAGSTFTVLLPLMPTISAENSPLGSAKTHIRGKAPSFRS